MSCADDVEGVLVEREEDCTNCSMESTWDKFQKQLQQPEMQFTYTLTASFVTERELSEEELGALVLQVAPQIEEPVNAEGDSVDYEIKLITCEIGSLLISEGN